MLCKNPYMPSTIPYPCGQCLPCRVNRRRVWTHRILLESFLHSSSCFLTLTYEDKHLPKDGSVSPRELRLFLGRLRDRLPPRSLRYFAVGEYGDETSRPHYHLALFGYNCLGKLLYPDFGKRCFCANCQMVREVWGKGHIVIEDLTRKSAQYIAGYVTKKMTSKEDIRLNGRHPEFARMSTKPGLAAFAISRISQGMISPVTGEIFLCAGDVPSKLNIDGKELPFGRYLLKRLRDVFGTEEVGKAKFQEKVLSVYEEWTRALSSEGAALSLKEFWLSKNAGASALLEARNQHIFGKGTL